MNFKTLPPDPDCFNCRGKGFAHNIRCECTMICGCGEERPNNLEFCSRIQCPESGCDSCENISWSCNADDPSEGDLFCDKCLKISGYIK